MPAISKGKPGVLRKSALLATFAATLFLSGGAPAFSQVNDPAAMQVRIDRLEEQVRVFSGQLEGLQFQMTQLQTLLERIQEDNEFRFQQLEDGGLGETEAATQSGGVTPTEVLPPETQPESDASIQGANVLSGDEDLIGEAQIGSEDELYASDVFGEDGVVLGAPEGPLGTTAPSDPLDLSFDPVDAEAPDADAAAQYQAAYDAVVRGEWAFAEDQFRQFVAAHPDHGQAPDATYWLGHTLVERGAYDEAADLLLTGFERYPTSMRAPDILLTLGIALHGTGEFDTACRTYAEVLRRYPDATQAFRERVTAEQARAGC
ncbi:tol-pal system protein YbgF [Pelagibacterium montanilacus]|uniref:tol-pal system protein YbgF n=1 Tax=Pelagibacterium montanilacus TaxID=2185280 RepID=UPI0013DEA0C0|nr:tol-pal system protein YbgF [Pelagibacterium montanilacus]